MKFQRTYWNVLITPEDLLECFDYVQKSGADYVLFDSDEEPVPELPVYDDETKQLTNGR